MKRPLREVPPDTETHRVLTLIESHDEEHAGAPEHGELWLVSYADLMTLLFGFFVMLYADSSRVQDLQKTFDAKEQMAEVKARAEATAEINAKAEALALEKEALKTEVAALNAQIEALKLSELKLKSKDSWSESAVTEQARLLMRKPCRICVTFAGVSGSMAKRLGSASGVVATHVNRGGPADLAGLRTGDVIEKIEGRNPRDPNLFESFAVGQEIKVEITRFGKRMDLLVKLDALDPKAKEMLSREKDAPTQNVGKYTVGGIGIRERITHYIPSEVEGLMVLDPCRTCGLHSWVIQKGDVIVSINGEPVRSPEQLNQLWIGPSVVEVWRVGIRDFDLLELSPG